MPRLNEDLGSSGSSKEVQLPSAQELAEEEQMPAGNVTRT